MTIYKENLCALGDTDFLRGVYINTLHARSMYKTETFTAPMLADNKAQIASDAHTLRAAAQAESTPTVAATANVGTPAPVATVTAPAVAATVATQAASPAVTPAVTPAANVHVGLHRRRVLQAVAAQASGDDGGSTGNDILADYHFAFAANGFDISANFGHNKMSQLSYKKIATDIEVSWYCSNRGGLIKSLVGWVMVGLTLVTNW